MAMLNGHPTAAPVMVPTTMAAPGGIAIGGPTNGPMAATANSTVIDGTPVRVVVYTLAAAGVVWALRLAGFKFNVGVSS